MKCGGCQRDILQRNPEMCPYCGSKNLLSDEQAANIRIKEIERLERAGRYEDAALIYEELELMGKAEECRKKAKTNYVASAGKKVGKISAIRMECPHCGASQLLTPKSNEIVCSHCGKSYVIPKKILDLL